MWYDILVLVVLVFCTARGASRGLIWQLAGIGSIILCLMFAETFSAIVGPHITLEPPLNEWVILFAAYLFFSFISFGVARIINAGIEKAHFKEYNRHLGAIFGLTKGGVICLVLTFFIATLPSLHEAIKDSKSGRVAAIVMNRIHPVMPPKLHAALEKYIHALDDSPALNGAEGDTAVPLSVALKEAADAVLEPIQHAPWSSTPLGYDEPPAAGAGATSPPPTVPFRSSIPGSVSASPASSVPPGQGGGVKSSIPGGSPPQPAAPGASDFWSGIRGSLGAEAQRQLSDAFQNLDPATQQQLERQVLDILEKTKSQDLPQLDQSLRNAAAARVPALIDAWSQAVSSQSPVVTVSTQERETLLDEISQLRSTFPQVQLRLQSEVRGLLAGVPDGVALKVLRDWKFDLSRPAGTDPDPQTDASTAVEMRILRQMELAGYRVEDLGRDLQDRISSGVDADVQLR